MWLRASAVAAVFVSALTFAAFSDAAKYGGSVRGSGRYARVNGSVSLTLVNLSARTSGGVTTGRFRLVLRSGSCTGPCPTGRITGTYRESRAAPDRGRSEALAASGRIGRLGRVRLTGTATGTGFIASGRLTIRLRLVNGHGAVTVRGQSAPVRGFTGPA